MDYPVRRTEDWAAMAGVPLRERIDAFLRNRRYLRRAKSRSGNELRPLHTAREPFGPRDIALICVLRDAENYIPSFLAHYRKLGVARFLVVSDRSTDRSNDLLRQPDVDLFASNVTFSEAGGGLVWRDMLAERYGRNRWYLSVDADEYLVFPGSEMRPVSALAADLERCGLKRAMAAMIDIYPDAPLAAAPTGYPADTAPTEICPLFDGDGYSVTPERIGSALRGGPRKRLFGADMRLTKFPLLYVDRWTQFAGGSHHGTLPVWRNYSAVHAVLLHYKFTPNAVAEFTALAERGTHSNQSEYYKTIVAKDAFRDGPDLRYPGSRRFRGSEDLVAAGFMQDLRLTRPRL
ncbi:MAG: glycosyltransferase family 2 protein [Methylobacterium mesophilicum]|nr:glycosyltransferase family 2 protein [Methylobacterium mesophilicum]